MKSTRKYILAVSVLVLGFAVPAISLHAEEASTPKKEHDLKKEHGPKGEKGERAEMMKEKLGLTEAQAQQMKQIHQDAQAQIKKLKEDESLSKEDKMAAMKKIHEATKAKMDALLTPEQRAKAKEMRAKAEQMRKEKGGGPDGERAAKHEKEDKKPKTDE